MRVTTEGGGRTTIGGESPDAMAFKKDGAKTIKKE